MGKVKFAVVGCGHIGKRHVEMILRNPEAQLVGGCDIDPVTNYELRITNFYSSIGELLAATDADVVNICTPNGYHADYAVKVLEAGKHVVVEKPLALSKEEGQKVLRASLRADKKVFCVMQNRYSPPSVWIKELVESGKLGRIYMVQLNCYWNRDARYYKAGGWHGTADLDGGTLFTQFSHFIDILVWLFGGITHIRAKFGDFNHTDLTAFEDSGTVMFNLVKGGMGCLNYSTAVWDKNLESSLTIIAENGSIKIGGQYMNEVEYCHVRNYEMPTLPPTNPGNDYGAYKGSAQNHHLVIDNVIKTLNGRATATTSVVDGLKTVEVIEKIYKLK
ncbi:oxidoreductase [Bacteroidia bacterium]|nr:oxidoreductase [Bacteroidia bacterium]GHT39698.1 oxidoreductase [Bacteroidia bacterium]